MEVLGESCGDDSSAFNSGWAPRGAGSVRSTLEEDMRVLQRFCVPLALLSVGGLIWGCGGSDSDGPLCNPACATGTTCVYADATQTLTTCQAIAAAESGNGTAGALAGGANAPENALAGRSGTSGESGSPEGAGGTGGGSDGDGDNANGGASAEGGTGEGGASGGGVTGELSDCAGLFDCFANCAADDQGCGTACVGSASEEAQVLLTALYNCMEAKQCQDENCVQTQCANEVNACFGGVGTSGGSDCGTVTFEGQCDGTVLSYCDNGTLVSGDCGAGGCGFCEAGGYFDCIESCGGGTGGGGDCGSVTYEGQCDGTVLSYCENGLVSYDCAEYTDCTCGDVGGYFDCTGTCQ